MSSVAAAATATTYTTTTTNSCSCLTNWYLVIWRLWFFFSIQIFIKKFDFDSISIFSPQYSELKI